MKLNSFNPKEWDIGQNYQIVKLIGKGSYGQVI